MYSHFSIITINKEEIKRSRKRILIHLRSYSHMQFGCCLAKAAAITKGRRLQLLFGRNCLSETKETYKTSWLWQIFGALCGQLALRFSRAICLWADMKGKTSLFNWITLSGIFEIIDCKISNVMAKRRLLLCLARLDWTERNGDYPSLSKL